MIDEETERAVESWVRLGDQVVDGAPAADEGECIRCGSRDRVLGQEDDALCARCYLERGPSAA